MLVQLIFSIIVFIVIVYMIIPNYIARHHSKYVVHRLNYDKEDKVISLTFDDGPDERYTEELLDLLAQHKIKVTFFIVAKKAKRNKHIIDRMVQEGHHIAMHSYKHKSAWLSFPWEIKKEFINSLNIFKDMGLDIEFFRPPWGTFNAASLKYARMNHLKVILWAIDAADWKKNNSGEHIADSITKNINPNDIIVLHDSGGAEGAPRNTLNGLKILLPQLIENGYHFVTIKEGMEQIEDYKEVIRYN